MSTEEEKIQEQEAETEAAEETDKDCTEEVTDKDTETGAEENSEAGEEQEETGNEEETTSEEKGKPEKKERNLGWTKKAKKKAEEEKDKAAEKAAAMIAEANDKYARLFAEFDNFRKRTEKEKASMFTMGAKDVVEKILPILDSFERGLSTVSDDKKDDPFTAGMDKVYKQFLQILKDMGVTPIEAVGKEFNPEFHNAVMHVDDESVGENIVVEEFQKGYMYKDSVVRFSMVKVAN